MAYQRYGNYQYETSPRKLEPDYRPNKNNKQKNKNTNKKEEKKEIKKQSKAKIIVWIAIGFSILLAISYRNSVITEKFNEKEDLKKQLSAIQKENEQLQVNIENSLNLNTVEQLAKERLGMQKLNNNQKVYVSLDKKDYIEVPSEEVIIDEDTSIWQRIIDIISKAIN